MSKVQGRKKYLNNAKQYEDYYTHKENGAQVGKVVTLTGSPICVCSE